jgi:hypothetical protein
MVGPSGSAIQLLGEKGNYWEQYNIQNEESKNF